jgi:hypothetical protein
MSCKILRLGELPHTLDGGSIQARYGQTDPFRGCNWGGSCHVWENLGEFGFKSRGAGLTTLERRRHKHAGPANK